MMKKILFPLTLCASFTAFSQVGINTPSPNATLDITAKNSTGISNNVDGLLVPRVDRQRAQSMTGVPVSTMIYVNNITTGTQTGTAANIDAVGYYYFNEANVWTKLKGAGSAIDTNIYNIDGTLTGNRVVSQEDKTLAFTSTATSGTNQFSVDGSTLSVDAVNNRMGVGTTTPQKSLHVNGTMQLTNELNVGGDATSVGNPGTAGQFLTSGGPGVSTTWTMTTSPINVLAATIPSTGVNQTGESFPAFSVSKQNNAYLSFNPANSVVTVIKSGYYQLIASVSYNFISTIGASVTSRIYKNYVSPVSNTILSIASTTYPGTVSPSFPPPIYHSIASAIYLNAGDTIRISQYNSNASANYMSGSYTYVIYNYLGQ